MEDILEDTHELLEQRSPAYSNVTVRRAFIVWMYCGHRNEFKDVCNYFHYLEALEEQLPPEYRAQSRRQEFSLYTSQPPISPFLLHYFPRLYRESCIQKHFMTKVAEIRNKNCVIKYENYNEAIQRKVVTAQEIVELSRLIRKYCITQMITVNKFLEEFKRHARKCNLLYTVNNMEFYIRRKMLRDEIELEVNYRNTLRFINRNFVDNIFNDSQSETDINDTEDVEKEFNVNSGTKPITILRKNTVPYVDLTQNCCDEKRSPNLLEDHSIGLQRERKFSGSRFMKIELEKFRKTINTNTNL